MRKGFILYLTVYLTLIKLFDAACPVGWATSNGNCYLVVYTKDTPTTCPCSFRRLCWEQDADLISVESVDDLNTIYNYLSVLFSASEAPQRVLLGITDLQTEGQFENLDGKPLNYVNWKPGEPNDGNGQGEDCVAIESENGTYDEVHAKWIDIPCCYSDVELPLIFCKKVDGVPFTKPAVDILEKECFGDCLDGWWKLATDRCYTYKQVSDVSSLTPEVARETCRQHGGDLPVIDTQEALELTLAITRSFNKTLAPTKVFLGLTDLNESGTFTWVNGAPFIQGNPMQLIEDGTSCATMTSPNDLWLPDNGTITWQTEPCCSTSSGISRVLCMRPVSGDYSLTEPDLIKFSCEGIYCPRGAFAFNHNGNTVCYNYFREGKTFQEAETICSAPDGSTLVVVDDNSVQQTIVSYTGSDNELWIGLHDRNTEGVWQWVDDTPFVFNAFAPSEPNSSLTTNCVSMSPNQSMLWTDTSCDRELAFLCARPVMYSKLIERDNVFVSNNGGKVCSILSAHLGSIFDNWATFKLFCDLFTLPSFTLLPLNKLPSPLGTNCCHAVCVCLNTEHAIYYYA